MITVEKLARSYDDGARGKVRVLDGVNLHVARGEFAAIVGRSGAGKSTLLHVLGGLDAEFTGEVQVAGTSLRGLDDASLARFRNETVGFVFQFFHLVGGLSALENVMLPAAFGGTRADEAKAREALARVGLSEKSERLPSQLSGGERQRVAIARALFNKPQVLLCDEPTGNLDAQTADEIIALFRKLNGEGLTIVAITHEDRLRDAASRVITLEDGALKSPLPGGQRVQGEGPDTSARASFSGFSKLLKLQLSRDRRGAMSSSFGIAMGIGALVFFVALGLGVGRVIREKVFPVDVKLIEVIPSQLSIGLFGGKLDEPAVERLAAMPGVERAYRKMNVRVPAVSFYDGDFFGRRIRMGIEVLAVGVDAELVKRDVQQGDFSDPGAGKPIPSIVSSRLLEIYNKTFAPARSLPQLSANMLIGFQFPVDWNRSFLAPAKGPSSANPAQVVGVSDRGLLAGITIPLDVARRLNREFNEDADTFTAVTLEAKSPDDVPALAAAVKDMGLRVDDQERRLAENAGAAVTITTSAMALLSALICLLAAFNIAHALSASVRAREKELGVMRAVGARRTDIFRLVLAEAALLGLAGGVVGTLIALGGAAGVDMLSARVLPDFPFKPDTFFLVPVWLPTVGIGLGVVAALAGAWLPARRASRVDPARVLAGQGT
ncbi:MAG: ATP-binding cassette domain-containing protein [Archangium sp.]